MIDMLFLWYPKCGTCRKAKAWLDAHSVSYELRDIKAERPTVEELRAWKTMSGLELRRFFNTSGLAYKALNLKERLPAMCEEEQLALLSSDGMLVRRPLLIGEGIVRVGFREKEYEALL